MAHKMGVTEETIRRWERGGARPSPDYLARLIVVLALDAAEFASLPGRADDLPALARALREERYQRAISQAEAGRILGVAQATYAGWEIGRSVPGAHLVASLAEFLGASEDEIANMAALPFVVDTTHWPPFGRLLGARRQALRLTRDELATVVGVSPGTIVAWELGYRQPRPQQVPLLAAALDVGADSLAAVLPARGAQLSALGQLIQSRQQRLGLRGRDIAERAKLDEATISRWVRGHHKPTLASLKRLAAALEVPFDVVLQTSGLDAAV